MDIPSDPRRLEASFPEEAYRKAGAEFAPDADAVFARSRLIAKVKEPQTEGLLASGHATRPFGLSPADKGLDALKANRRLAKGLNVLNGQITHPAVPGALGKPFSDAYGAWA